LKRRIIERELKKLFTKKQLSDFSKTQFQILKILYLIKHILQEGDTGVYIALGMKQGVETEERESKSHWEKDLPVKPKWDGWVA